MALQRFLIGFTLVAMPFFIGGARPWIWSLLAAFFLFGVVILNWRGSGANLLADVSGFWRLVFALFLAYPLLQVVPLPKSWLAVLSPHRLMWIEKAEQITGIPAWLTSISYTPMETLFEGFIRWLFLLVFALVLRKLLREEKRLDWLFNLLFIFAAFEAFYGLLQVLIPSVGVLWVDKGQGLARGTFTNRNHYACFLGMLWPVLLGYVWGMGTGGERREARGEGLEARGEYYGRQGAAGERVGGAEGERVRRFGAESSRLKGARGELSYTERERLGQVRQKQVFYGFVIGLMILGIFFSQSRGGILGSLVSLTVLIAVSKKMRTRGMLFLVVGSWAVMLFYGSIIGFDNILRRFDQMELGAEGRFQIWRTAVAIISDHPRVGTGLGSFLDLFRVYQDFLDDKMTTSFAHNDYLHLTVELGIPAAAVLILLVWGYWWRAAFGLARGEGSGARGERRENRGERLEARGEGVEGAGHRAEGGEQRVGRAEGEKLRGLEGEKERRGIVDSEWGISERQAGSHESGAVNQASASRRPGSLVENEERHAPGRRSHIRQSASNSRNPQSEIRNLISVGALAGAAAFLCHCWVEFNWQIPATALYFVMLLVLLRGEKVEVR